MAGFLRKVAGAFVYLDDSAKRPERAVQINADEVVREAGELVAQLGGAPGDAARGGGGTGTTDESAGIMGMTATEVFAAAGIVDGPNSAQRVLKILAGLSMFPREQQVVMVRAMDAADDSWSEEEVLANAELRQSALREHWQAIEGERARQLQWIESQTAKVQADGQQALSDIDSRMGELQKLREQTLQSTGASLHNLDVARTKTEEATARARKSLSSVSTALSELIAFFRGAAG